MRFEAARAAGATLPGYAWEPNPYDVVLHHQKQQWFAYVPALPGRIVTGRSPEAATRAMHRVLAGSFRRALAQQQFRLYYQPAFDLVTTRLAGMEALVRWAHPTRGLLLPGSFLPAVEQTGLMDRLDDWVLREACQQTQAWRQAHSDRPPAVVRVNLSRHHLFQPDLARQITSVLGKYGVAPSQLSVDVAAGVAMQQPDATSCAILALREAGIQVILDNLSAEDALHAPLASLAATALTLDRSLIHELGTAHEAWVATLVKTVIRRAHAAGMTVTAEGVETARQQTMLRELSCDYGQGFYLGRPATSADAAKLLFSAV